MGNFAYETYKDVEAPQNFASVAELAAYREQLRQRTQAIELPYFLSRHPEGLGRVLEVGSGNSRILYGLWEAGLLTSAVGIEISPSRVNFADAWKEEMGDVPVENICGDFLKDLVKGPFDSILCVTSIFPFFDMLETDGFDHFLRRSADLLVPGGTLFLETVTFASEIKTCELFAGSVRLWEEFRPTDPFRYSLIHYAWHKETRVFTAETINIMRDQHCFDGPTEKKWHMEETSVIEARLRAAGFEVTSVFGDYDRSPFAPMQSLRYLAVAKKT